MDTDKESLDIKTCPGCKGLKVCKHVLFTGEHVCSDCNNKSRKKVKV